MLWILHWTGKNDKGAKCFRTEILKAVIHTMPFQIISVQNPLALLETHGVEILIIKF